MPNKAVFKYFLNHSRPIFILIRGSNCFDENPSNELFRRLNPQISLKRPSLIISTLDIFTKLACNFTSMIFFQIIFFIYSPDFLGGHFCHLYFCPRNSFFFQLYILKTIVTCHQIMKFKINVYLVVWSRDNIKISLTTTKIMAYSGIYRHIKIIFYGISLLKL